MFYKGWPQVQNNRRAPYCTWDCLFGWANSTSWTRLLKSTPERDWHQSGVGFYKGHCNFHFTGLVHFWPSCPLTTTETLNTEVKIQLCDEDMLMNFAAWPEMFCPLNQLIQDYSALDWTSFVFASYAGELVFFFKMTNSLQKCDIYWVSKWQTAHWHLCRLVMD